MIEATRSRVAKVVAVVFALGAVTAVVWWAQSRGERIAAVGPTRVQQQSLRPAPTPAAPVPTPPSILADRPLPASEPTPEHPAALKELMRGSAIQDENGRMSDAALEPFGPTYFSSSKSLLMPSFDEPSSERQELSRKLNEAMKAPFDVPGEVRNPAERNTYFSTSKSAFAPSFDEPARQQAAEPIAEPAPDAR